MRFHVAVLASAALVLTGCEALKDQTDIVSRLKAGDTTVCAEPEVQKTFLNVVAGDDTVRQAEASGHRIPSLTTVNSTGVNKDIGEVSCSGNFEFPEPVFGKSRVLVEFKVRPALDKGGGYVVATDGAPGNQVVAGWLGIMAADKPEAASSAGDVQDDTNMNVTTDMNATDETGEFDTDDTANINATETQQADDALNSESDDR